MDVFHDQQRDDLPPASAARVSADLVALHSDGSDARDLGWSILRGSVAPELLDDKVLGHADLAAAMRDFVAAWDQRLGEYADHLDMLGGMVTQQSLTYRAADNAAATTFASGVQGDAKTEEVQ